MNLYTKKARGTDAGRDCCCTEVKTACGYGAGNADGRRWPGLVVPLEALFRIVFYCYAIAACMKYLRG